MCYCTFDAPIRPKDHIAVLRPFLPAKYSPLQVRGDGLQSVYWAEVPELMAGTLIALIGQPYYDAIALLTAFPSDPDVEDDVTSEVEADAPPTIKEQLVKARRGQGVFRSSVLLTEDECRVTHVTDARHLRASHIKPWRDATNAERFNGWNGLLLSPHVDHLFDQGYISFSSTDELLVVPEVRTCLLDAWGIDAGGRSEPSIQSSGSFLSITGSMYFEVRGESRLGPSTSRALRIRLVIGLQNCWHESHGLLHVLDDDPGTVLPF